MRVDTTGLMRSSSPYHPRGAPIFPWYRRKKTGKKKKKEKQGSAHTHTQANKTKRKKRKTHNKV